MFATTISQSTDIPNPRWHIYWLLISILDLFLSHFRGILLLRRESRKMEYQKDDKRAALDDRQRSKEDFAYGAIEIDVSEREKIERSLLWKIDLRLMPLV